VALWIDGVLHVIESQDGWYWPKHGIQRNTYKQWIEWARNAGFNVVVLPLSPEVLKYLFFFEVLIFFFRKEKSSMKLLSLNGSKLLKDYHMVIITSFSDGLILKTKVILLF
jgi:hypothetical protein